MNPRPNLAAFLLAVILCTGILVVSYSPKQKPVCNDSLHTEPDTSFSGWWTKTRNSEEHRKFIKDYRTEE